MAHQTTADQPISKYSSWRVYLRLLRSAFPYWASFVLGIIGTLLATGTDAALTWAIEPLLSNWAIGEKLWWFKWLSGLIVLVLIIRGSAYFLSTYYLTRVGRNLVRDFRQQIFAHLLYLPASYYEQETSGKLLSTLIYDTEQVAIAATEALITVLQEGLLLIGFTVVMLLINWQLTLMFLLTAPVVSLIVRYTAKRLRNLSSSVQSTMGDLTQIASEGIENFKVIRIFGGEHHERTRFFSAAQSNRQHEMKVVATSAIGSSLTQIIAAVPLAMIVFVATRTALHQQLSAASLSAFVFATLRILTPLRRLAKVNTEIQRGVAGAQSVFTLLDEPFEPNEGKLTVNRVQGKIEYRDVSFSYSPNQREVLQQINFQVKPGQVLALVGASGGGKSTLVSLLPRFYDPSAGSILIDGVDIRDYHRPELRRQISMVSQYLTLFNDTIAHNIAYGALGEVGEAEIRRAAEAAHVMEFVQNLPEGLNTRVGENGLLLSGGQRQRIAIARALLKNAPILILDEATSALDSESERSIQDALEQLMERRTTLVIAHRLSTVERADQIVVIERGKVIETGNHAQLLKLNGQYAKLYQLQFSS